MEQSCYWGCYKGKCLCVCSQQNWVYCVKQSVQLYLKAIINTVALYIVVLIISTCKGERHTLYVFIIISLSQPNPYYILYIVLYILIVFLLTFVTSSIEGQSNGRYDTKNGIEIMSNIDSDEINNGISTSGNLLFVMVCFHLLVKQITLTGLKQMNYLTTQNRVLPEGGNYRIHYAQLQGRRSCRSRKT